MTLLEPSPSPARELPGVKAETSERYLFGPWRDFLGLGGGSILPILLLVFVVPESATSTLAKASFVVVTVFNHPHFAHSYQIFYRDFRQKLTSQDYPVEIRRRYLLVGLGVPVLILGFVGFSLGIGSPRVFGQGVNAMIFLAGWHYVKQGYGMLMLESVLKKRFFSAPQKKVLLFNAYANWPMSWMLINDAIGDDTRWGISYAAIDFPTPMVVAATVVGVGATLATAGMLIANQIRGVKMPLNGLVAYGVSIYLWRLVPLRPLVGFYVSVFHSLQYQMVVWRFELNRESAVGQGDRPSIAGFILKGIGLGAVGFWILPFVLSDYLPYDRATFGDYMPLLAALIFINVHHYFIDTVIWRRTNPEPKQYLFAA